MLSFNIHDKQNIVVPVLYKQYFNPAFDYSGYQCIHKDGYDYYPELHTIIVDDTIEVMWETGKPGLCEVDLENPKHLKELLDRGRVQMEPGFVGTIRPNGKDPSKMSCSIGFTEQNAPYKRIPVDGTWLYYLPEEYDLKGDLLLQTLAKCLFIGRRYDLVEVVPYKNNIWGGSCI